MWESAKKSTSLDLREISARTTLRHFRHQGHVYVELRRVGKRSIFFCALCQVQCFNDSVLKDHLNGGLHSRRLSAAKISLLGPNPWPFSDGVLFFTGENAAVVPVDGRSEDRMLRFVPGVLLGDEVSKLKVNFVGYGHIGSKVKEGVPKVWCAWLGSGDSDVGKEMIKSPRCDFAVVTFTYRYGLGRKYTTEELEAGFVSSGSFFEVDDSGRRRKRRKKSFSDPEDSEGSNCVDGPNRVQGSVVRSPRAVRRELRKEKLMAAERTCDICRQPMLPGKDVSSLLNCKTGRLFCSSRNSTGAFHLFHTSCILHWILRCEYEIWINTPAQPKIVTRGRKPKLPQNFNVITSVFCPECQGTGIRIEGEEYEKATVLLPKMFLYKLDAIKARNVWTKNPEDLHTCSTGLEFEPDTLEKFQEKAMLGKVLQFYRADE